MSRKSRSYHQEASRYFTIRRVPMRDPTSTFNNPLLALPARAPARKGGESNRTPGLIQFGAIMRKTLTNFFYLSRKKPKTVLVHKEIFQERVLLLGSVLGLKYKGCKSCIVAGSCVPTFCCLIVIVSKSLSQGMLGLKRKCRA